MLEGQEAEQLNERIRQRNREARAETLQQAKAQAAGREPFDLNALRALVDLSRWTPEELEYKYYVENPELKTMREFAELLELLWRWRD